MSTLDAFLGPHHVEERCSNCGKILGVKRPKYTIIKDKEKLPYCRDCAKPLLPKPVPKKKEEDENTGEPSIGLRSREDGKVQSKREDVAFERLLKGVEELSNHRKLLRRCMLYVRAPSSRN